MADEMLVVTEEECRVLAAWQLGPIHRAAVPTTGTVNRTIILHSESGSFVLRVSSRGKNRCNWEHECISFAADQELPVCRPIPLPHQTMRNETILERGGRFFALFPLAAGHQIERTALRVEHTRAAGECLASIHAAFQTFPVKRARVKNLTVDTAEVLASISHIEAAVQELPTSTNIESATMGHLVERRRCLEQNQPLAIGLQERLSALPQMVLHGDYQETNLFFQGEKVSAVIDWDQPGMAARGWEVVRALHLMLRLAPDPCRAFLSGYRSVLALPDDELEEAAVCYGVLADSNLWVYSAAYLEGNERAKKFIEPGPFVPFELQWKTGAQWKSSAF